MSLPLSPEQKAARWGTVAKFATILGIGFVVAPYVWTATLGILGLATAAIVTGGVMVGGWMLLPVIGDAAKNMRLKMIKAEAARNPIESLESEYLRRSQLLNERKNKIEALAAKTAGFGSKLAQFKRQYPTEAPVFEEIYNKMTLLLKRSREQWTLTQRQLEAFAGEIEKAKAKWAMALAAADLRQDAGRVEEEFLAKLKVECSFDTIETGMNSAFAQLDTLLMESEAIELNVTGTAPQAMPVALPAASQPIAIELPTEQVKTPVRR